MYAPQSALVLPATLFAGVGLILRWVVCDGLIVQLAPRDKLGRVVGFHETLMGLGIVLGPILIGWFDRMHSPCLALPLLRPSSRFSVLLPCRALK